MTIRQCYLSFLIAALVSVSAQTREQLPGLQHKAPEGPLKCRIWTRNPTISKNSPATLQISLENVSSHPVRVTSLSLNLVKFRGSQVPGSGAQYYAPVDIEQKTALKPIYDSKGKWSFSRQHVIIAPGEPLEFNVEVTNLAWESVTSPILPYSKLFGVVPDGVYREYVTAEVEGDAGVATVESNRLEVELRRDSENAQ